MATTTAEIRTWFEQGVAQEKTHMIIVCDTFDYDDYPVYVSKKQNVHKVKKEYDNKNMQRVIEVYCLSEDMEKQLALGRCFCYAKLDEHSEPFNQTIASEIKQLMKSFEMLGKKIAEDLKKRT